MELNFYQDMARQTAIYTKLKDCSLYPILGLCGEAGEVAEKVKKHLRDGVDNTEDIILELGDVLWYIANIAEDLGFSLQYIAEKNLKKLSSRNIRNKLHGEGDNR